MRVSRQASVEGTSQKTFKFQYVRRGVVISAKNLFESFRKMRRADRFLPHNYTGTYESFERLYKQARDPWGLQYSPLAMQRYLTLIENISQETPCTAILDVGCGEGVFTKYLTGFATEVVGIDVSPTAIERAKT